MARGRHKNGQQGMASSPSLMIVHNDHIQSVQGDKSSLRKNPEIAARFQLKKQVLSRSQEAGCVTASPSSSSDSSSRQSTPLQSDSLPRPSVTIPFSTASGRRRSNLPTPDNTMMDKGLESIKLNSSPAPISTADCPSPQGNPIQMPTIDKKNLHSEALGGQSNNQGSAPKIDLVPKDFAFLAALIEPPTFIVLLCNILLDILEVQRFCRHTGALDWGSIQIDLLQSEKLARKSLGFSVTKCPPKVRSQIQKLICIPELRNAAEKSKQSGHETPVSKVFFWATYHCSIWRNARALPETHSNLTTPKRINSFSKKPKHQQQRRRSQGKVHPGLFVDPKVPGPAQHDRNTDSGSLKPLTPAEIARKVDQSLRTHIHAPPQVTIPRRGWARKESFVSCNSELSGQHSIDDSLSIQSSLETEEETHSTFGSHSIGSPSTYYSNARGSTETGSMSSLDSVLSPNKGRYLSPKHRRGMDGRGVQLKGLGHLAGRSQQPPTAGQSSQEGGQGGEGIARGGVLPQAFLPFPLVQPAAAASPVPAAGPTGRLFGAQSPRRRVGAPSFAAAATARPGADGGSRVRSACGGTAAAAGGVGPLLAPSCRSLRGSQSVPVFEPVKEAGNILHSHN